MPLIDMGMLGAVRCFFAACVELSAVFNGLVYYSLWGFRYRR